jgi:hypothetical protein
MCGLVAHAFAPTASGHRCERCGLEQEHCPILTNHRLVDVGAWDSTFGPYDLEYADEVCSACEKVLRTDVETGYKSGGPYA